MNRVKPFIFRMVIISLILYSVSIIVYFLKFYKPLKSIEVGAGDYKYTIMAINNDIQSMNRDEIEIFLIISLLICIVVAIVILIIYNEIEFYFKPVQTISASLKSKESVVSGHVSRGGSSISYSYYLTFVIEDGTEMTFAVLPGNYAVVFQGNKGLLKYKKGIANRFVGFDITSIE